MTPATTWLPEWTTFVAEIAVQPTVNGMVEIGGPEKFKMCEIVRRALEASGDGREVVRAGRERDSEQRCETTQAQPSA